MTPCPRCASDNTRCYDENTQPRYLPDNGEYDGDDIVASFVCDDCRYDWLIIEPDDDVCAADDGIIDDEDAVYAPPADSRSEDARD